MKLIESEWEEWQEGAFSRAAALKERHSANEINVFRLRRGRHVLIHSDAIQRVHVSVRIAVRDEPCVRLEELLSLARSKRNKEEERQQEQGRGRNREAVGGKMMVVKEFTWTGPMLLFLPPGMPSSLIAKTHNTIIHRLEMTNNRLQSKVQIRQGFSWWGNWGKCKRLCRHVEFSTCCGFTMCLTPQSSPCTVEIN